MHRRAISGHAFPPGLPVPLDRQKQFAIDLLNHAYNHLCDRFPCLITRDEQRDNVDARLLVLFARDAAVSEAGTYHDGDTIGELEGLVENAERRQ